MYFDPGEDGRTIGGPGLGQNHREFGCWEPGILRRIGKLDVPTIRQVFGRERETYDTVASHDDVLDLKRRRITIAPQNTIASFMEANLLSHPHQDEALVRNQGVNFLDALESDTKRMVTNFWTWLKKSEEKLHQEHNLLLEELEGQLASSGTKE